MPPPPDASPLTAVVTGEGTDVVLVHGALGDYRQWTPIAEQLARECRVHCLSRRYHWPNTPPARDTLYTYEGHTDDLLAYLRAPGTPVHLVGHSYGAGVVLLAALREPALIRTLTLIEPALHSLLPAQAPDLDPELASRAAMTSEVKALVAAGHEEAAARAMIDWTQGGPGGFARLAAHVQDALLQNAPTIGPMFATPQPTVTRDQFEGLQVATLLVRGERTRLYYRLIGETVVASVPGVLRAELTGAGHMTIVERPAQTAVLLLSFLNHARV